MLRCRYGHATPSTYQTPKTLGVRLYNAQCYKRTAVNNRQNFLGGDSYAQVQRQVVNKAWYSPFIRSGPRSYKTHADGTSLYSCSASHSHSSSIKSRTPCLPPKSILVFCDGTGKDALITEEPLDERTDDEHFTNVLRLSRSVTKTFGEGDHPVQQITHYQSGIGRATGFAARGRFFYQKQKAFGTAVAAKIRDAYSFIAQNYVEGDQICIFGYSRGGYTARKVAGLIDRLGLLCREDMGNFFTYWKQLNNNAQSEEPPRPVRTIPIKCVGTWDDVGSVYDGVQSKIDALTLKDAKMPSNVEIALHAVAFHENRGKFPCMLYTGSASPGQTLKQVWFPGAHSDVGGGYAHHELADISLAWMVGEIESFVGVDRAFVEASLSTNPKKLPWGKAVPRNAYARTPWLQRLLVGYGNRLDFLTSNSMLHPSLLVSPHTKKLITISELRKLLPNWNPEEHVVQLNSFERRVQEIWHDMYRDEKKLPKLEGLNDLKSMFYKDCMGSHGPNCRGHRRKGPSIRRSVVKRLHPSD